MKETQRIAPLEHVAPVYVEVRDGYVDVQQAHGDKTLYTPEEARDIAEDIRRAADRAENPRSGGSSSDAG